jgi:hypothetical protein
VALSPGTRIGPHDVTGPIGAGGMGEGQTLVVDTRGLVRG